MDFFHHSFFSFFKQMEMMQKMDTDFREFMNKDSLRINAIKKQIKHQSTEKEERDFFNTNDVNLLRKRYIKRFGEQIIGDKKIFENEFGEHIEEKINSNDEMNRISKMNKEELRQELFG